MLWDNNSIPLRVLGLLLRFLVLPIRGTGGVVPNETGSIVMENGVLKRREPLLCLIFMTWIEEMMEPLLMQL